MSAADNKIFKIPFTAITKRKTKNLTPTNKSNKRHMILYRKLEKITELNQE